jgi:hypothetical protein
MCLDARVHMIMTGMPTPINKSTMRFLRCWAGVTRTEETLEILYNRLLMTTTEAPTATENPIWSLDARTLSQRKGRQEEKEKSD